MELDIRIVTGGPLDVNTYVVGLQGSDECLIIDPGAEVHRVQEALEGRKVCAVLLTHGHFDHMLYAGYWLDLGARLYIHEADAPALRSTALNLSAVINQRLILPQADVLLHEGDVIREAGFELTVLHTPGHTPGGVCYLHDHTLFCGDTLFYRSCGRVDLPGGDENELMHSLHRLMQLDEETIAYPGHDMKTKIAWERRAWL